MDQAERLRNIIKQQNKVQNFARVITVTSGKGGVGKSNISVNLAIQLSRMNKRVIVFDADFGLANIEVMLGIRPKYSLADVLYRGKGIKEVVCQGPENIGFISGGSGLKEMTNLNRDQIMGMMSYLQELDQQADVIVIDTGAGIADSVIELVAYSQEVLLVATPEPTSITDAYALLKTLRNFSDFNSNKTHIKMVGNRIQSYEEGKELFDKLHGVIHRFLQMNMEYLGAIPYDENILKAVMNQMPVSMAYPNSNSARAMLELAMVLETDGEKRPTNDKDRGISSLFSRIFRRKVL